MKIIDRYILSSYLQRLVGVFAICMIIFIIQTFWLFVDDLAGKGLDLTIIFKFLLYYSPKLVPLVLPLSVLLASLMTYGDLAENYEFAAMKSTGISLQRAMRGLVLFHIFLGISSFYFSNHVIPYGELKSYNLRKNLAKRQVAEIHLAQPAHLYGDNVKIQSRVILHQHNLSFRWCKSRQFKARMQMTSLPRNVVPQA